MGGGSGKGDVEAPSNLGLFIGLTGFLPPNKQGTNECEKGLDGSENNSDGDKPNGLDKINLCLSVVLL